MVGQTGLYSCQWCCGDLYQVASGPGVFHCVCCRRTVTFSGPERAQLVRCDPDMACSLLEVAQWPAGRSDLSVA